MKPRHFLSLLFYCIASALHCDEEVVHLRACLNFQKYKFESGSYILPCGQSVLGEFFVPVPFFHETAQIMFQKRIGLADIYF